MNKYVWNKKGQKSVKLSTLRRNAIEAQEKLAAQEEKKKGKEQERKANSKKEVNKGTKGMNRRQRRRAKRRELRDAARFEAGKAEFEDLLKFEPPVCSKETTNDATEDTKSLGLSSVNQVSFEGTAGEAALGVDNGEYTFVYNPDADNGFELPCCQREEDLVSTSYNNGFYDNAAELSFDNQLPPKVESHYVNDGPVFVVNDDLVDLDDAGYNDNGNFFVEAPPGFEMGNGMYHSNGYLQNHIYFHNNNYGENAVPFNDEVHNYQVINDPGEEELEASSRRMEDYLLRMMDSASDEETAENDEHDVYVFHMSHFEDGLRQTEENLLKFLDESDKPPGF